MNYSDFDVIIVGSGISGCVMAERCAEYGKRVLVLEKRNHVGGNCFDFVDENGILRSKYGPHIFRTNNLKVWNYIKKFGEWQEYKHKVVAHVKGKLVPIPVNLTTINTLYEINLKTGEEMKQWLESRKESFDVVDNAEKQVLSLVGREIYELIFKNYTRKQWGKDPSELDASITARIPVRYDFDDRYYQDRYQFQPILGFTEMIRSMLSNKLITVELNADFFDLMKDIGGDKKIIFTGPVDDFFKHRFNKNIKLEYRSLRFKDRLFKKEFFQTNAVINFPGGDTKHTRITEHKYITGQKHRWTVATWEYPQKKGEPYYPIINKENIKKLERIKTLLKDIKNVVFIGRLGKFEYINMDVAVDQSLAMFEKIREEKWLE